MFYCHSIGAYGTSCQYQIMHKHISGYTFCLYFSCLHVIKHILWSWGSHACLLKWKPVTCYLTRTTPNIPGSYLSWASVTYRYTLAFTTSLSVCKYICFIYTCLFIWVCMYVCGCIWYLVTTGRHKLSFFLVHFIYSDRLFSEPS